MQSVNSSICGQPLIACVYITATSTTITLSLPLKYFTDKSHHGDTVQEGRDGADSTTTLLQKN